MAGFLGRVARVCGFAFIGLCAATVSARAAGSPDVNIQQEKQEAQPPVSNAPSTTPPESAHLLETWNGILPYLASHGVALDADYYFETAGNVAGGRSQGAGYADQRKVSIDIDYATLAGLPGLASHVVLINRAGDDVSANSIGDRLFSVTEIYGGGGNVPVHLAYAYFDETLFDGRLLIAAGRPQVGVAFFASPIYCNFMTLALCAEPRPIPGGDGGFTNGGANNFGGFVRARPTLDTYVEAGVFEVNPNRGGATGFDFSTQQDTGALFPVEIAYEPGAGEGQLPGHYKLGAYYDTSAHNDLYSDVNGNSFVLSGLPARRDTGQYGIWAAFDQMVLRNGSAPTQGLILFGAYSQTEGDVSLYQSQAFLGLTDRGFIPGRPKDELGTVFIYNHQSAELAQTQEIQTALGLPLAGGAIGPETHEEIFETYYLAHVFRGVDIGPDFQYVIRPGASDRYGNAVVFGLQGNVRF